MTDDQVREVRSLTRAAGVHPTTTRLGSMGDAVLRTLAPGERSLVPTGVALAIPDGWVGLVHPRSGLAAKHGISIVNAPGTVDAGYRGEILVNLINLDPRDAFTVRRGDRIAQLVVQQVARVEFLEVDSLEDTSRGDTGHGASGGFGDHPQTTKD
jgi:dUTP pyrophosphatase